MAIKTGAFEYAIKITNVKTGKSVDTVTTPSMWATSDEWVDTLRARTRGEHTHEWYGIKQANAVFMLAAIREGVFDKRGLSLEHIAEFMNECEVEDIDSVPVKADGEGDDPFSGDPEPVPGLDTATS